jgi:hypothetical protein
MIFPFLLDCIVLVMRIVARAHRAWFRPPSSSWIHPVRRGGDNRLSDDETGTHLVICKSPIR